MTLNFVDIEPQRKVPRDGNDRPMIYPPTGGTPVAHTRMTTFIKSLEDEAGLTKWGKRMVTYGAAMFPHELEGLAKLDPEVKEDKAKLDKVAERLFEMSGANNKREKGTYLHKLSEYVDEGTPLPDTISAADLQDMMAYMIATTSLTVLHSEQIVVVPELVAAGTPDRVSVYDGPGPDGKPLVGNLITDLKTGTLEYGGLKMSAQLAGYAHGYIYHHEVFPEAPDRLGDPKGWAKWKKTPVDPELAASAYEPLPDVRQDWGIIINLRPGSGEATLHWADLTIGWEAALMAKSMRAIRSKSGKALVRFAQV
jgi:hypothetical protein